MMKKLLCALLLVMLLLPGYAMCETRILSTPVTDLDGNPELFCADEETRAMVAVGLLVSYAQQEKLESLSFQIESVYMGYNGDSVYTVLSLTKTQRIIFEFDTKYDFCSFLTEDNTDMTENEKVIQELCPDYNWKIEQKPLIGAFSRIQK